MERIQGLNILDQKVNVKRSIQVQRSIEEEEEEEDTTIPFLQMLQQSEEEEYEDISSYSSFKDANFLALLSLQTLEKPPWWEEELVGNYHLPTHEVPEFHSSSINEAISSQELPLNSIDNANSRRKRRNNNNLALTTSSMTTKEKRKRKRSKPTKNIEEMENQRMTHIAVERNRRRQMNVHLNSLRSLIPPSYIQRGDQASIVGGAIDFVKILEQHLQSLESQKMTKQSDTNTLRDISSNKLCAPEVKIEARVIESHVNLKIQCQRRQGQLLRSIILLEKLRFTVLHLNITSPSNTLVSYSFNLKMEDGCDLGSADEITTVVRQIFDET